MVDQIQILLNRPYDDLNRDVRWLFDERLHKDYKQHNDQVRGDFGEDLDESSASVICYRERTPKLTPVFMIIVLDLRVGERRARS
jgi:hypothetical protein